MIGFFEESDGSLSMSRLCMLIGVIGGVAYAIVKPNADWRVVSAIMIGGCLPYIFNRINETKEKILDNPKLIEQLVSLMKGIKNA